MITRAPTFNFWRAAALLVPFATILLATLAMPLPFAIKLGGEWLMPSLPILAIFLWAMYRPDLLPPFAVLVAGLLMDLLIDAPLGVSALAFLAAYAIVISQRLYWATLSGPGVLVGFVIVMFAAGTISWLATSFAHGQWVSPVPVLLEGIMSVIVFPLARHAFEPLHRLAGRGI
jgi:rod shape-determining protein MreD